MSYEFKFPDIGEGLTEGKILELKVSPGAEVNAGDILAIVETDKVVAEIASPKSGVVVRFGSEVGERISVGATLAYIDVAGDSAGSEGNGFSSAAGRVGGSLAASAAGEGGNGGRHQHQALVGTLDAAPSTLPPSDETAGDATAPSAAETATGHEAAAGVDSAPPAGATRDGAGTSPAGPAAAEPAAAATNPPAPGSAAPTAQRDEPRVTPAARRRARDLNVDLQRVQPSRGGGRIQRGDVERAAGDQQVLPASLPGTAPQPVSQTGSDFAFPLIDDPLVTPAHLPLGQTVELTILRKTIAHTMETSRKIPTATIFDVGVVEDLVELRAKVNAGRDVRVSFQPFFMKALATALRRYPVLNAHFNPVSDELTVFKDINIGVAVNTEAGLMVPVIHNVENKTIRQIDTEMKDMVERAKGRQIRIEDLRGGTFSLTNFGPFGGLFASPMIYPPQVAIIGAGRIHQAPMVVDGAVRPAWVLPVSLAFDHRVVDGVPAAEFSSYFLDLLRVPQELFVSM
jgi:pyruvate dehydrogenase E2 component (dihydrolipoamide acetyltransferase)